MTVNWIDVLLFASLARAALLLVSEFNRQDIANTTWAFAVAGFTNGLLFAAMAWMAEMHVDEFKA